MNAFHRLRFDRRWPSLALGLAVSLGALAAAPADAIRPWNDYRAIMWIGDTAYRKPEKLGLFFQRLREMGVNTAMVYGGGDPRILVEQSFPYYVENMVNRGLCLKYNSRVTDWDRFVTEWARDGRPEPALTRDICLDDPQWRAQSRADMQSIVRLNRGHRPLAYDIRDELSTTISANPFDYDFNPVALAGFRAWLRTQYRDLAALNAEWETQFSGWDLVKPFTTDQIKSRMTDPSSAPGPRVDWQAVQRVKFDPTTAAAERSRWNFAPWCDFRSYMDLSLANALDGLRGAARELDPATPVGIEGTQMPSAFGGYDLWRLSRVLDWVEPYDIACSREILGSFMPGKPILATVFEGTAEPARRRLWHLLLEGDRGCLVWWSEDCINWTDDQYSLSKKGLALAPVLKEMTSPLAQLFLRAERQYDPIFIHYSQPSIQVDWLIESTVDGSTWLRRFSSFEADHNQQAQARDAWLKAFQDLGYSPRFVSSAEIESGVLRDLTNAALALPRSWALSESEVNALNAFLATNAHGRTNNVIFSDISPGAFDEHGKRRASGPLDSVFPPSAARVAYATTGNRQKSTHAGDFAGYAAERLGTASAVAWSDWIQAQLGSEFPPSVILAPETPSAKAGQGSLRVRVHRFRLGAAQLLAFERNIDYHMAEELKQAGGNEQLETPITFSAKLPSAGHLYELREAKYLGRVDHFSVALDPWQPSLYAVLPEAVAPGTLIDSLLKP